MKPEQEGILEQSNRVDTFLEKAFHTLLHVGSAVGFGTPSSTSLEVPEVLPERSSQLEARAGGDTGVVK